MTDKEYEETIEAILQKYRDDDGSIKAKTISNIQAEIRKFTIEYSESKGVVFPIQKCCICGKQFKGYGNNSQPVKDGVCCDDCNVFIAVPIRMSFRKIKNLSETSGTPIQTIIDNIVADRLVELSERRKAERCSKG